MERQTRIWIFLPGWAGDASVWDAYRSLPGEEDDVLFLDYGYFTGKREFSPLKFRDVLDNLSHSEIIVVGYSFGGLIALGEPSPRIKAMILFSAFPSFCCSCEFPEGKTPESVEVMQRGIMKAPEVQIKAFHRLQSFPQRNRFLKHSFYDQALLCEDLEFLKTTNHWDLLGDHKCPVLILHGAKDKVVSQSVVSAMKSRLRYADAIIFPDDGHLLIEHQTKACIGEIKRFLKKRVI